ncbi:MAG: hypothetical protein HZA24_03445 [Nitrospirae bacterium]|nr:hypothetical protein [Nitrospirota bacterium]
MRKWPVAALVLAFVLALLPARMAHADDIALQKIMRNALYGGAVGALVGTAMLAFADRPSDHLNFITNGAAAGVLIGAAWGIYDSQTAYVSLEHGAVHTAMPTPVLHRERPSLAGVGSGGVMLSANLLGVRF